MATFKAAVVARAYCTLGQKQVVHPVQYLYGADVTCTRTFFVPKNVYIDRSLARFPDVAAADNACTRYLYYSCIRYL